MSHKKKWCGHMKWCDWISNKAFWILTYGKEIDEWLNADAYRFKWCPKCGARRPK